MEVNNTLVRSLNAFEEKIVAVVAVLSVTLGTHWSSGGYFVLNHWVYFATSKSNLQNKKVNK